MFYLCSYHDHPTKTKGEVFLPLYPSSSLKACFQSLFLIKAQGRVLVSIHRHKVNLPASVYILKLHKKIRYF